MTNRILPILLLSLIGTATTTTQATANETSQSSVTLYKHGNYGGYSVSLEEGEYGLSELISRGMINDDISSLTIPPGFQVSIFQHDNFGGFQLDLTSDTAFVGESYNDQLSSIKITFDPLVPNPNTVENLECLLDGEIVHVEEILRQQQLVIEAQELAEQLEQIAALQAFAEASGTLNAEELNALLERHNTVSALLSDTLSKTSESLSNIINNLD